jgi:hypothetical protein
LQRIRAVLGRVLGKDLPPPEKPHCFAREGEVLSEAVLLHLRGVVGALNEVRRTADALRPYMMHGDDASFPHKVLELNRALGRTDDLAGHIAYRIEAPKR